MPRRSPAPLVCAAFAVLALAACSPRRDFPSLAKRPIEQGDAAVPAPAAPVAATPAAAPGTDAALDARAAGLARQAVEGDAVFRRTADGACATIAKGVGAAQGSEAWIAAQEQISAVDAARGPVKSALADLDQLLVDRSAAPGEAVDTTRLLAAETQVSALDAAEQARVAGIQAGRCGAAG